jgi:hypothetical protein
MSLLEHFRIGGYIIAEQESSLSREEVTFAPTTTLLESGTLVGKLTSGGHYAPYSNAATDGTGVCVGILYTRLQPSTGVQQGVITARLAEVDSAFLIGLDAPGTADLAAINGPIIVR